MPRPCVSKLGTPRPIAILIRKTLSGGEIICAFCWHEGADEFAGLVPKVERKLENGPHVSGLRGTGRVF